MRPAALVVMAVTYFRRCTYRRVTVDGPADARRRAAARHSVECAYPALEAPIPLGDLAAARGICEACTYPGIFRADDD